MRCLYLLTLLGILFVPFVGCGGQPDPQDREDFVDTSDPNVAADMLTDPAADPKKPAAGP